MAESTLSISYDDLAMIVADYLGIGRNSENWSADETSRIDDIIKGGLNQFYFPPQIHENQPAHQWSFLVPEETLTTVADTADYDLPDDFGGIEGDLSFDSTEYGPAIRIVGIGLIKQKRQGNSSTGKPELAAIEPKTSDGSDGQRFQILLWPTPNDAYTLAYRKVILPDNLTSSEDYPYGGMVHRETVIASCLAMAERRMEERKGVQWEQFMERLTASIAHDLKAIRTEYFGYNADRSSQRVTPRRLRENYDVTVNGSLPYT